MANEEREKIYQNFKQFRDEYYNEHKRNPYACHAFTQGFRIGQEKVRDDLKRELYQLKQQRISNKEKNELIKDMMHLLEQTVRDDVTKFTKFNMNISINRAKKLLNLPIS